jgi:hypothetical protein
MYLSTYIYIYILAEMPGVARAGLRTPLESIVPSLHLSLFGLRPPLYSLKTDRTGQLQRLGKHLPGATARYARSRRNDSVNTFPGQRPPKELHGPPQSYIRSANGRSRGNGLRTDQTENTTCLLSLQCNILRTDQKRTPKKRHCCAAAQQQEP